jgi:hypothetical protein
MGNTTLTNDSNIYYTIEIASTRIGSGCWDEPQLPQFRKGDVLTKWYLPTTQSACTDFARQHNGGGGLEKDTSLKHKEVNVAIVTN